MPIRLDLTEDEMARFLVQKWRFPGVELASREFRQYPFGQIGAHLLGYMGRISESDAKRIEKDGQEELYRGAYNIGKVGIERTYEDALRGQPGFSVLEVTAGGRPVRYLESTRRCRAKTSRCRLTSTCRRLWKKRSALRPAHDRD